MSHKNYPEPIVGAFIFNTNGKMLLVKSHKWKNHYVVPGGHIELGETINSALTREVLEETGLKITNTEFLCVFEFINEGTFHIPKHMIFLNYKVKTNDSHVMLNDEAQEFIWVTTQEALELPIEMYTKKTIEEYLT